MSTNSNSFFPFPGMSQSGDTTNNPFMASMEMMQKAWNNLTSASGLAQALPMTANAMNPEELERRIADLRSVENWLRMNLSMLGNTIQALEVQKSTISTLRTFVSSMNTDSAPVASPLEVALGLKPANEAPAPVAADSSADATSQLAAAPQAWWNMLQQQFNQLAEATTNNISASLQKAAETMPSNKPRASKKTAKKTTRSTAKKTTTSTRSRAKKS